MSAAINWRMFSTDVQARWSRPVDMKADLGFSQSTLMAAWHGKPIGALPMLQACAAMGAHPLRYLGEVDQPEAGSNEWLMRSPQFHPGDLA